MLLLPCCKLKTQQERVEEGKVSNLRHWKKLFFYVWDVDRIRIIFNIDPSKGVPSPKLFFI